MQALIVAKLMAQYLGQKDLLGTTSFGGEDTPTAEQQEKIDMYITSINDVVQSLGISYFSLKDKIVLNSLDGTYSYDLFTKPLLQILTVTDSDTGAELRYTAYDDSFTTTSKHIVVEYIYQPGFIDNLLEDLDLAPLCVTSRLVALGAVSRYYLLLGLYTESAAWSNMFERAILVSSKPARGLYIDKRSWY